MVFASSLVLSGEAAATQGIRTAGSDLYNIFPRSVGNVGKAARPLQLSDVSALQHSSAFLRDVWPVVSLQGLLQACNQRRLVTISGALPEHLALKNLALTSGRFIGGLDLEGREPVAVLATTTLPTNCVSVGDVVRVSGAPYRVIGLSQSTSLRPSERRDDVIYIPLTTAVAHYGERLTNSIAIEIRASSDAPPQLVRDAIERTLRRSHAILPGYPSDFRIESQTDLLGIADKVSAAALVVVISLLAASLVVAAIGVLNSITTSVVERTAEIGLRRAVGARQSDIRNQFMFETVVVVGGGTAAGLVFGVVAAVSVAYIAHLPLRISGSAQLVSTIASLALGMSAGLWPALRAARLRPIDALRHE